MSRIVTSFPMKTKLKKLDLRLTEEQYVWLNAQAEKSTVGMSTYLRQLLEQHRVDSKKKKKDS